MDSGIVALIVILVIFLFGGWLVSKSVYIVQQAEAIVIERLGKFTKVLEPGVNFVVPFVDAPHSFTWRKTSISPDGYITDETTTTHKIDLRESVFNFLRQEVFTKDTVYIDVNSLMYYRINNAVKAVYEVDDLLGALSNTAQTQLKEVFGNMTFSQALASQRQINEHLVREFSKVFGGWGIHVERMELLDLQPNQQTQTVMKKQMVAERTRRGEFVRSEGRKAAMRLTAEGSKVVKLNMGLAEQEATRKRSEGEAGARVELASAESTALETLGSTMQQDGSSNVDYLISQRYLDLCRDLFQCNRKTVYLPYEATGLKGVVAGLGTVYGRGAPKGGGGGRAAPRAARADLADLS